MGNEQRATSDGSSWPRAQEYESVERAENERWRTGGEREMEDGAIVLFYPDGRAVDLGLFFFVRTWYLRT